MTWLKILHLLLQIFVERGKSAPARREEREREKFNELASKKNPTEHELVLASVLLRDCVKRLLRPKGRSTS